MSLRVNEESLRLALSRLGLEDIDAFVNDVADVKQGNEAGLYLSNRRQKRRLFWSKGINTSQRILC